MFEQVRNVFLSLEHERQDTEDFTNQNFRGRSYPRRGWTGIVRDGET